MTLVLHLVPFDHVYLSLFGDAAVGISRVPAISYLDLYLTSRIDLYIPVDSDMLEEFAEPAWHWVFESEYSDPEDEEDTAHIAHTRAQQKEVIREKLGRLIDIQRRVDIWIEKDLHWNDMPDLIQVQQILSLPGVEYLTLKLGPVDRMIQIGTEQEVESETDEASYFWYAVRF